MAEVARRREGPSPKSLSPNLRFFVAIVRFVAIYALFGNLWAKKCFFRSRTVFLGQEAHYYMVYIAYYTELHFQICFYAQKRRICPENSKYALAKNFFGHFCALTERLPTSATLAGWLGRNNSFYISYLVYCPQSERSRQFKFDQKS